jgi:hypothetical protein
VQAVGIVGILLQANCSMVYKKVFLFLLTRFNNGIDIGNCTSKDLFAILQLYELGHVLRQHLDGETHHKYIWKRVVRESISRAEEQSWCGVLLSRRQPACTYLGIFTQN